RAFHVTGVQTCALPIYFANFPRMENNVGPIVFITGNENKAREVSAIMGGLPVTHRKADVVEKQSFDLREVVEAKVRSAYAIVKCPVMVEDVSLELECLGGFPGPFVKFWHEAVGYDHAMRIATALGKFGMIAKCGSAYFDGDVLLYSEGVDEGRIVQRRGESTFGFDPYF